MNRQVSTQIIQPVSFDLIMDALSRLDMAASLNSAGTQRPAFDRLDA